MGKPVMETVTEHWGLTLAGLLGAALLLNAAVWKIRTRPLYKKPLTLHNGQGRLRISLGALEDLVWQSATKAAPLRVKAASVRDSGRKWLVSLEGEITGPGGEDDIRTQVEEAVRRDLAALAGENPVTLNPEVKATVYRGGKP